MASYSFQLDILKSKELFEYPMKGHETLLHPKTLHTQQTADISGVPGPLLHTHGSSGLTSCRLRSWVSKSQTRALPKLLCTPQAWGLAGWGGGPPAPVNELPHSPSHPQASHPSFLRLTLRSPHPHSSGSHLT